FIGGALTTGNMADVSRAAEDPFFFLLHGNVDRLWSMWQRAQGETARYDPADAYTGTLIDMTQPMAPWNGYNNNGTGGGVGTIANVVRPWTTTDGYITDKPAYDPSVVFPPIYDTAPLTIPVLQGGESVVIEIPWYPPNPADFACFGFSGRDHVCLLARIETSTNSPYGMTYPEGSDVDTNTRNNNKIAWKNVNLVNTLLLLSPITLRNLAPIQGLLQLSATLPGGSGLFTYGNVMIDLGPTLYSRWMANGGGARGFTPIAGSTLLRLTATNGVISNLTFSANEAQQVSAQLALANGYPDPRGQVFTLNLEQYGGSSVPGASNQFVGGQQIEFDFNQLTPVPTGSQWRYLATGQFPGPNWNQPGFDDSGWPVGTAKLGFGDADDDTIINGGPPGARNITTWFRYDFTATNSPGFYRNLWLRLLAEQGAVAYLNGVEIDRLRMPAGAINPGTPATTNVSGLAGEIFYPTNVSQFLGLLTTSNVLAVEVHQFSPAGTNLAFDAELSGNVGTPTFPPQATFLSPPNGSLFLFGQPVGVTAAALSPTGTVVSVGFYVDGQFLGALSQPPYTFFWANPTLGTHQFTAVATNSGGLTGSAFVEVQVLSNLPPRVVVTSPPFNSIFLPGDQIPFNVSATEQGGTISQVDFYAQPHGTFFTGPQLVGSVTSPPYSTQLSNLVSGGYFLSATATDALGAQSDSSPVFIEVATVPPPVLTLSNAPPYIILNWSPGNAALQQSPSVTGPWQTVSNATSPYQILPTGPGMFFRAQLP
ncbi:MAG TPA: Ig-like domain-containing protein, partial [Verrucomicrobiae bacterium]|nr:Ig-like domain-containing protein [Verrucomicrobiae bacterium]